MKPQKELEWEIIYYHKSNDSHNTLLNEDVTLRAAILNGWLVRHIFISTTASTNQRTDTMTFVPDKKHSWK